MVSGVTTPESRLAITPVSSAADLERFLRVPWAIYGNDSPWVPPLLSEVREMFDPARNPFHDHADVQLFVAEDGGRTVGRVAAIVNHAHQAVHHDDVGFFGFFESKDDSEVAALLLETAADWLAARGIRTMRGPINPSVNDEVGLLLNNFDGRPTLMMPYTPPYYVRLLEENGVIKVRTLYAYLATRANRPTEQHLRLADRLVERYGITVRNARIKDAKKEGAILERIYNQAWEQQWGAVAMTHEEAVYLTKKLKTMADERMVLIASLKGEPAAFALAVPDWNHFLKQINGRLGPIAVLKYLRYRLNPDGLKGLRLMALGVLKEHRRKGLEALMILEMFKRGLASGYQTMEISWVLEDNAAANNVLSTFGLQPYRTYGLFEKPIG
ncbi:MAG: N-acetyltransferase [Dehalococcoidia bacterium]|nr:N-acetyltransferase [Dehalococcoidia bacterium]